jgi:cation diffusion facilitator family transporter
MEETSESAYKLKMLKLSAVAIASVVIVEVILGSIVNSLAILSDGLHALLDALTSVILFVTTREALKPPDEEHTYGHEKFEPIGGLIGGIVLIGVGVFVIYEAITKLVQGKGVDTGLQLAGFFAIGYTFCIDIYRIFIFRKAAKSESTTVKAGFYHALADFSSTGLAFLGFGLATIGINQGDSISSIVLGILLSYLSIKLVVSSVTELTDTASKGLVQRIRKEILSHNGILNCKNLKVRKVGSKTFAECTIQVSSRISLENAHALASEIESDLQKTFGNVDSTIHIEPSEKETETLKLVGKLATVDGVKEVHDIETVYAGGKLNITLHAYVNPQLSVERSHEIAEKIEKEMHIGIKQVENVTVHLEPYGVEVNGNEIDENDLREIIQENIGENGRDFYIKRITTYSAEGKRYINLDCCFTNDVSITTAHDVTSRIEHEIQKRFAYTVVTVHIEPHST